MKTTDPKIRVLIADDHKIVRAGLASLLGTENDIDVVGQAANGREAVEQTLRLMPDVVLMDLMMPVMDGVQATENIHVAAPRVKVVILTTFGTSDGIAHALTAGATGALMKNADDSELADAIRKAFRGEEAVAEEIRLQLELNPPVPALTPRQRDILDSMVRGLTNPDIAKQFGICQDRVKEHINAILVKLGAANRTEAATIALRKHLLKV